MAEERIYTINLSAAYQYVRTKRTRRAVHLLRAFVARHSKVAPTDVRLSEQLNMAMWKRSMQHPPRSIRVKVEKKDKLVHAQLPDEKPLPKREPRKKGAKVKKEKATPKKPVAKEKPAPEIDSTAASKATHLKKPAEKKDAR